ncbi:PREDICTED: protein FAR1-RELATED SEQUENCE 5-like [Ipomoea nil]|uniref:protein FAR1-RELATED SEQUENCE 5-like n=1 Tax=Ipomoea nil TaxID=35883 RepID=UPI0009014A31|nr:PREDICTED: protein FAR1-RELATED SEQUENCE 5-like [Ipomoea nil]
MAYIEGADAQLVIDKYMAKKEVSTDFYFAHDVDELDQLCRIFWADPQARHNFKLFGDVLSFDATYSTNRYKLVFVPFTGMDHHKKSVTFAVRLIAKEDLDSYTWLLEHFKTAMGRVPTCTVTDQDPAMRVAISRVFDTTRHRYCMWHIMTKVGIGEQRLQQLHFPTSSLTDFFIKFEKAINKQRHTQTRLNADCEDKFPELKTTLLLERQAATTYTIAMFYDVQKEILEACFSSQIINKTVEGNTVRLEIEDTNKMMHSVEYNSSTRATHCTCNMFNRIGLQCRHLLLAFKDARLERIPGQYITPRWTRTTCWPYAQLYANPEQGGPTEVLSGGTRMGTVFDEFFKCVGNAYGNTDRRKWKLEQRKLV